MHARGRADSRGPRTFGALWLGACVLWGGAALAAGDDPDDRAQQGRDLFLKEWLPGTPSDHGGDGLGPVYNDSSCVACHNQGGAGGAGPASKNVDIITAVVTPADDGGKDPASEMRRMRREMQIKLAKMNGEKPPQPRIKGAPPDRPALIKLHAGFQGSSSIVLHRFGTDPKYERLRLPILDPDRGEMLRMVGSPFGQAEGEIEAIQFGLDRQPGPFPPEHGDFTLIHTQRNPLPLFGNGLIDAVSDAVLEAAERTSAALPVKGRPGRLPDGRIGRFGWKAQAATLDEFVLTACAVELGLEVPGHPQGLNPRSPGYRPPGLDLTRAECDALTTYVRGLPAPARRPASSPAEAEAIRAGEATFAKVGCAACHSPRLGHVEGIYSDLLLHDMGDELSGSGIYGRSGPEPSEATPADPGPIAGGFPAGLDAFQGGSAQFKGPSSREWRTPPLWGVRDSGPYLHDGRAETLEQAIALHGGQGEPSAQRYFGLSSRERLQVQAFLKSLVAPALASGTALAPATE
jgi:CxxC motif-containing protein (DUF1111 family)